MKIQYGLNLIGEVKIGDILYCCDVMKEAIKNHWVEIDKYQNPPYLVFDTDGTWEGISKYCYNCGRKVELKEMRV